MAIRVVHIGTGNVGRLALAELIENPAFELVGLCVSTPAKIGKDAGELAGLSITTGVTATDDLDALLATQPECAVYCAMGDTRMPQAMDDVRRILAAGVNVVGSAPGVLQFPWQVIGDQFIRPIEDAARLGDSSVYVNGVDPGFITDLIPLAFASTCRRIEQVRCMEIADYATYDGAVVM
ncbi:MAG: diacylglycerol kinase, partial [Mycobacteriaceae bacterium]